MVKRIAFVFYLFAIVTSNAQIYEPVKWEFTQKTISEKEIELQFKATIDEGWHIYSQHIPESEEITPVPTSFTFEPNDAFVMIEGIIEGKTIEENDPNFDMVLKYFENKAIFKQKIKTESSSPFFIKGYLEFMACDDSKCLPPEFVDFVFEIIPVKKNELIPKDSKEQGLDPESLEEDQEINIIRPSIKKQETKNTLNKEKGVYKKKYKDPKIDLDNPLVKTESKKSSGLWHVFILGLLGGLIALITPCVFPMIPLTVSFFTKTKGGKGLFNAILYGFFIMLIYFLLSIPFHVMPDIDPEILNQISTNTWLNILFFFIFIAFAFSFFGYYDLKLPSKWGNKTDSVSNIGGIVGIFFMALTLAIVSFSCTGPILGSLLAGTLQGDVTSVSFLGITSNMVAAKLTVGMTGFGIALGLPFAIFALFPKLLDSLPQSGGWLNSVKVVLGFLEVALAIKFLSNADMVEQWGLIKRETFFTLWFIIGILIVLYLFGKIKFPHDSPLKKISVARVAFISLFSGFTIYLIPGVFGSYINLWEHSLLSGFPPPIHYSYTYEEPKEKDSKVFKNYWKAIEYAEKVNKPLFIDFTGWACVNCRKMEENVFTQKEVDSLLKEFIICQLYVDDREKLTTPELATVPTANGGTKIKKIRTTGEQWSTLQSVTYGNNSQPYYVLYSWKDGLITDPVGYTPDEEKFTEWLKKGLKTFQKHK